MNRDSWLILCLAYVVGLLTTGLFYFQLTNGLFLLIFSGFIIAAFLFILSRYFQDSIIDHKVWLSAGLICFIAISYFYLRIPQPSNNDISHLVPTDKSLVVEVRGKVLTEPRLNSNNKLKFWLEVSGVKLEEENISQDRKGRLYVTVPLLEGNNIYPQDLVTIKGTIYKPKIPLDKTQFNFARYLQEKNTFAGLTGFKIVNRPKKHQWGWYRLRRRIIRAHVKGLGSPWGQLISSIAIGRRAVDLPDSIRNPFVKSGLAHILAASGFHVSLLLGFVLQVTNFLAAKQRFTIGIITLLVYSCLTGFSPSIIRATLMGVAVLIAMLAEAKVRPLGALLIAAVIILLLDPLWIWNLSFQLSFLATLGLVISLPVITNKLDFLPTNLASAIAVPLAASIWVLPVISYVFNTVPTYSIFVNILTTPLVAIICLGGTICSGISLVFPSLGSSLVWVLKYPLFFLFKIAVFFANLPGSNWAVGKISLWLLLSIYGAIILLFFNRSWQKRWWLVVTAILLLVLLPIHYRQQNLLQVTILDTGDRPSIVICDRDRVILINKGNVRAIQYQTLPFLASQGINRLDYLIVDGKSARQDRQTIKLLQSQVKIENLVTYNSRFSQSNNAIDRLNLQVNPTIITNAVTINPISEHNALQLKVSDRLWFLTDSFASINSEIQKKYNTLVWWGNKLQLDELNIFNEQIIIARNIPKSLQNSFSRQRLYLTENEGTVTWTPNEGFTSAREESLK